MIEFSKRLNELMKAKGLNAEQLANELAQIDNNSISANTIRNYIKDKHKPTNMENIQILAEYFNVSTDYIQGYTKAKTNNVDEKNICNKYGLSEESLLNLEKLNSIANKNKDFTHIKTINCILSQNTLKIWTLIDRYLNINTEDERILSVKDGKVKLSNTFENKSTNLTLSECIEGGILQELSIQLNKLKKEVEENECKRTGKK